jgi:hypothetical protein
MSAKITTTFSVKLPRTLAAQLAAEARAKRIAKADIVIGLLKRHYLKNGKKHKPTAWDLMKDLVGCFDGPGDLSTNPKHMEGYGR